jgi:Raf kinase inhibitor-like YbhB/YbcL family protein
VRRGVASAGALFVVALLFAGCSAISETTEGQGTTGGTMQLRSAAFAEGGEIPARHATTSVEGGRNVSIPYSWSDAPDETESFALALVDTHPIANEWVHWLVVDIPNDVSALEEGASGSAMPSGARELASTYGTAGYGGPQPPPGTGAHSYEGIVYALDVPRLDIADDASLADFEAAIEDHIVARARLAGVFER